MVVGHVQALLLAPLCAAVARAWSHWIATERAAFGTFVRRGRSSMVTLDCDGAPTEQSHQRIRVVTG